MTRVATFARLPRAGRLFRRFGAGRAEGSWAVACASAAPLAMLAIAVVSDYATVSWFRIRVQRAAEAASLAAADLAARHPEQGADAVASRVAAAVFGDRAPRGAGTPTVAVKCCAPAVAAIVGYAGVAPSNFGTALGYDSVSADASATSLARIADSRSAMSR